MGLGSAAAAMVMVVGSMAGDGVNWSCRLGDPSGMVKLWVLKKMKKMITCG